MQKEGGKLHFFVAVDPFFLSDDDGSESDGDSDDNDDFCAFTCNFTSCPILFRLFSELHSTFLLSSMLAPNYQVWKDVMMKSGNESNR